MEADHAYVLSDDAVQYRILLGEHSALLRIDGRLPDGEWTPLVRDAGMLLRVAGGEVLEPPAVAERCTLEELAPSVRGRVLCLKYTELLEGRPVRRTLQFRLLGHALEIEVDAPGGKPGEGFCGFVLGALGPEGTRAVAVPGLPDPLLVLPGGEFLSGYPDRYFGRASAYPPGAAFYREDLEGFSYPVVERFYLCHSDDPLAPLPGLRRPAAPYRAALLNRVTLDFFSESPYARDAALLRLLPLYGLRDVLLIYRNWQQFGYERRGPLLYPADPDRGSNETFRRMLDACAAAGWLVALREEYATMTADSPYWTEKALAQWPDGQPRVPRPGRCAISSERMLDFARLETTKIQRNYHTTAVFADAHTAWNPEGGLQQVDAAPNSHAGSEAQAIGHVAGLLQFLRDIHEGPVVGGAGEGPARFDTFAEGLAEAVIRGLDEGRESPLVLDYELADVRPRLLGIGAGSYRQFSTRVRGELVDANRFDWDAYRATAIALGHAGYTGNFHVRVGGRGMPLPGGSAALTVREYYLLRALQEQYLDAPLRQVLYRRGDELVDLAAALREGLDLTNAQVRIEYGNGLMLWVNRSAQESWTVEAAGAAYELPPSGFLAAGPELIAYSAIVSGNRADYVRSPLYTFLDTRAANPRTLEGIAADGAVALLPGAVPERPDVVMVGARQLTLGEDEYRLSERGDLRLTHLSERDIEVTVMDTENGKSAHVTWPAFTPEWKGGWEVQELTEGAWCPSRVTVTGTRGGPQLNRALPGVTYRIRVAD